MIRVGILGGAGYTGGELLRLILNHPECKIVFVHSNSQAGKLVSHIHTDLTGDIDLKFAKSIDWNIDVLFLCLAHGDSKRFLENNHVPDKVAIIDFSQDFRLTSPKGYDFVYGLPEIYRDQISKSHYIANPGCFATSIQLALLPLAKHSELQDDIHINAITGSTGAGQGFSPTSHFSWRSSNVSFYKVFTHEHLKEISKTIDNIQPDWKKQFYFVPMRGNFTRGILAGVYTKSELSQSEALKLYRDYYESHPFVIVSDSSVDLKQVINTNKCLLHIIKENDNLFITSAIDNLVKGAAGQAVQNMNLIFGLNEETGLRIKPIAF